jgi:hypothetical protein
MSVDDHYDLSQALILAQEQLAMVLERLPEHDSQRNGIEDVLEHLRIARAIMRRPDVKQALCQLPEDPAS